MAFGCCRLIWMVFIYRQHTQEWHLCVANLHRNGVCMWLPYVGMAFVCCQLNTGLCAVPDLFCSTARWRRQASAVFTDKACSVVTILQPPSYCNHRDHFFFHCRKVTATHSTTQTPKGVELWLHCFLTFDTGRRWDSVSHPGSFIAQETRPPPHTHTHTHTHTLSLSLSLSSSLNELPASFPVIYPVTAVAFQRRYGTECGECTIFSIIKRWHYKDSARLLLAQHYCFIFRRSRIRISVRNVAVLTAVYRSFASALDWYGRCSS